jgi:hypothetical protein
MKKIAAPLPDFFPGTQPTVNPISTPATPVASVPAGESPKEGDPSFIGPPDTSRGDKGVSKSWPTVVDMQRQLIGLAQDVTSQINIQQMAGPGREAGEASGRNAFGDFITENYLSKSDVPGVEFDPDPSKQRMDQKQPTDPSKMDVVMDTMRRIGNPKGGEFSDDGKWGPRTNAAIHNAYAFAFAMLKLAQDFHAHTSYTEGELQEFKPLIPEEYDSVNITEKLRLAPEITRQIKAIRNMYRDVKQHVLEKPANRAYIEGDRAFHTYKRPGTGLTPDSLASMSQQFDRTLRVSYKDEHGQWADKPITVKDLLNPQSLAAWQKANVPHMPLENILNSLRDAIGMQSGTLQAKVGPNGQVTRG